MATEKAWAACDFSAPGTYELQPSSSSGGYQIGPADPGFSIYLASAAPGQCEKGVKLYLSFVAGAAPTPPPSLATAVPTASPTLAVRAPCSKIRSASQCRALPRCAWKRKRCASASG